MDKILVSGGAGFIGNHLLEKLLSQNKNKNNHQIHFTFYNMDIRNRNAVLDILVIKNRYLCHLATRISELAQLMIKISGAYL
jgi:nucleoside-diphosphate-sugar epimerase